MRNFYRYSRRKRFDRRLSRIRVRFCGPLAAFSPLARQGTGRYNPEDAACGLALSRKRLFVSPEDRENMSRRNLGWLLAIAAISLLGITVSYSAPTREKDKDYELVRLVVDVLHEVRQRYVVDIDQDRERKLVEDMINGGLERLDPHSSYIHAARVQAVREDQRGQVRRRRHPGRLRPAEPRPADRHQSDARHAGLRGWRPGRRSHR